MKLFTLAAIMVLGLMTAFSEEAAAQQVRDELIQPVRPAVIENEAKVELGKKLFFEPRLSRSGFISCNSCHNLSRGGSDNLPTSIGHSWQEGTLNSPTVLNSSLSLAQFWDGRADTLAEQAAGPISNPVEMAYTHILAVEVLRSIPEYREVFESVYGEQDISIDQVTDAIAAFEETLVTPNSRFDQWLKGDDEALTDQELSGYETFKQIGCVACHYGEAVGGKDFYRMGIVNEYATENLSQGRYEVTGDEADRFSFKVPTLRNVERTYPYFHDGAVWTLEEATEIMAYLQLGRELPDQDIDNVVAFLRTLTGEQPNIVIPQLPPSRPQTPRPQPFER